MAGGTGIKWVSTQYGVSGRGVAGDLVTFGSGSWPQAWRAFPYSIMAVVRPVIQTDGFEINFYGVVSGTSNTFGGSLGTSSAVPPIYQYNVWDGTIVVSVLGSAGVVGQWKTLVGVSESDSLHILYEDGIEVARSTTTVTVGTGISDLKWGRFGSASNEYNTLLGYIWHNRALSPQEVFEISHWWWGTPDDPLLIGTPHRRTFEVPIGGVVDIPLQVFDDIDADEIRVA